MVDSSQLREWAKFHPDLEVCNVFRAAADEIDRLRRGEFTTEEFQNFCHNRHESPGCTLEEFRQGCREYQGKLFGVEA